MLSFSRNLLEEANMNAIRKAVVVALLAVWSFPAASLAKSEPASAPAVPSMLTKNGNGRTPAAQTTGSSEAASFAEREQQAQQLQDFKGGGVSIYVGSGVLLVLVIVLLILLI